MIDHGGEEAATLAAASVDAYAAPGAAFYVNFAEQPESSVPVRCARRTNGRKSDSKPSAVDNQGS
jgi:hypothetical protein